MGDSEALSNTRMGAMIDRHSAVIRVGDTPAAQGRLLSLSLCRVRAPSLSTHTTHTLSLFARNVLFLLSLTRSGPPIAIAVSRADLLYARAGMEGDIGLLGTHRVLELSKIGEVDKLDARFPGQVLLLVLST